MKNRDIVYFSRRGCLKIHISIKSWFSIWFELFQFEGKKFFIASQARMGDPLVLWVSSKKSLENSDLNPRISFRSIGSSSHADLFSVLIEGLENFAVLLVLTSLSQWRQKLANDAKKWVRKSWPPCPCPGMDPGTGRDDAERGRNFKNASRDGT